MPHNGVVAAAPIDRRQRVGHASHKNYMVLPSEITSLFNANGTLKKGASAPKIPTALNSLMQRPYHPAKEDPQLEPPARISAPGSIKCLSGNGAASIKSAGAFSRKLVGNTRSVQLMACKEERQFESSKEVDAHAPLITSSLAKQTNFSLAPSIQFIYA